jgi:hypothetical protein
MKIREADIAALRVPVLALGLSIFLAAAWMIGTRQYHNALKAEFGGVTRSLSAAKAQLANAKEQDTHFTGNAQMYKRLVDKGLFGPERRLEWIDKVNELRERHQVFSIDYDISAQRKFEAPGAPGTAAASKVELKIDALHEGDVFGLLKDLVAEAPGVLLLESCSLRRLETTEPQVLKPNVGAVCVLQWITLKDGRI